MSTLEKEKTVQEKQILEHTNIESSLSTNIATASETLQSLDDTKPSAANISPEGKGSEGVIHESSLATETNPNVSPVNEIPFQRQVIAVSASKNPGAFFNLARRFLVTDEYVDLSALEGAIITAVDAAHLLARSKLATIVRSVFTTVEWIHHIPFMMKYICFISSCFTHSSHMSW
jgi:hypothetical protein